MKAQDLKNSILKLAMEGKLVPQNLEDEPASVLLEKIRAEKEKLIKAKKIKRNKKESIIYRENSSYYEKIGTQKKCIDDEIPFEIPTNWEWARFSNFLSVFGGKRVPKGYELLDNPTNHIYIRVKDMKHGTIVSNDLRYIDDEIYEKIKKYVIHKNDLYLTIAGTIGKVGSVPDQFDGMNLTENAVKLTNILINKKFLKILIDSNFVQLQFIKKTNKVAQPKLAIKRILATLLPIPPIKEQERIVKKIEELIPYIEEYGDAEEKLEELNETFHEKIKASILQEAIQGKLVPQDPDDVTAKELLSQIRKEKEQLIKDKKIKRNNKDSIIFKDKGHFYEKVGKKSEPVCIDNEIPFDIPDTWEWVRLGNIVQINPRNKIDDDLNVSFIPMTLIDDGYNNSYSTEVRKWSTVKSGYTHFAENDIGIAKITPCFQNRKSVIFDSLKNGFGAGTTELHILRPFSETLERLYLLWFSKTSYFIDNGVKSFTGTAGQQRVGKKYIENCLFPLPPSEEQKRIVKKIEELRPYVKNLINI